MTNYYHYRRSKKKAKRLKLTIKSKENQKKINERKKETKRGKKTVSKLRGVREKECEGEIMKI